METRSSIFSSSCAVLEEGGFFMVRLREVAIGWQSFFSRQQRSHTSVLDRKMHLVLDREQLTHERP